MTVIISICIVPTCALLWLSMYLNYLCHIILCICRCRELQLDYENTSTLLLPIRHGSDGEDNEDDDDEHIIYLKL